MQLISFYKFVYDRQSVWYNKERLKKPYPWTDDERLRVYKFCNVYRELDKGTKYLINTVINNKDLTFSAKVWNIILYRRFNTMGFFNLIDGPIKDPQNISYRHLLAKLDIAKRSDIKLFNDAYIVSQQAFSKTRKKDKHAQQVFILEDVAKNLGEIMTCIKLATKAESVHGFLKETIYGTGDFMAYQYLTDITYCPEAKKLNWVKCVNDFVAMGPGSKPGVDILYPENGNYIGCCHSLFMNQEHFFNQLKKKTGKDWLKINYKTPYFDSSFLSLSNIQNTLCEFRKYVMLEKNPNKRKRYYKPEGAK